MSTTFKKKLSHFISGQLPEYVVAEYPQFVQFLTSYYKFLETTDQAHDVLLNNASWIDIDITLDIFLPEYKKQYAADIPDTSLLAIRRLLKYISEYYEAKGSENATELFFRFMYNDQASVVYPGDYILRASDGKWSRKKIIKVDTTAFSDNNIFELTGKKVNLKFLRFVIGEGDVLTSLETSCFNVIGQVEPNIYQLEVDIDPNYVFPDKTSAVINVDINDDGVPETIPALGLYDTCVYLVYNKIIYGVISNQIISVVSVDDPGSNFRVDDSYSFFQTVGNNAVIRVKEVTGRLEVPNGSGITEIQLVTTGQKFIKLQQNIAGDPSYFSQDYTLSPDNYATDTLEYIVSDMFTVNVDPQYPRDLTGTPASITFKIGIVRSEEGTFKDASGFLSDINYLQDNYYYQPYSYVIRSQQSLNTWKDVYSKSNHPAGFKIFSELQFIDTIQQSIAIIDDFEVVINQAQSDRVTVSESITTVLNGTIRTTLADSITVSDSISFTGTISRNLTDSSTISDSISYVTSTLSHTLTDSVTISDSITTVLNGA